MNSFLRKVREAFLREAAKPRTSLAIRSRMEVLRDEERNKRIVPEGGGYPERDARSSTLDPEIAAGHVARERRRALTLTTTREDEIDAGLVHLTPAAQEIEAKAKRGLSYD